MRGEHNEIRKQLEEARTARERLFSEVENLRARAQVDGESEGLAERMANVNRAVEAADGRIADLEAQFGRMAYLERIADDPRHREDGAFEAPPAPDRHGARDQVSEARSAALRTLESYSDRMESGAPERLDAMIRHDGPTDQTSRYVEAVGNPHYKSAFAKLMQDPAHGHLRFSAEEVEAVRVVSAIQAERAGMNITTVRPGGFALPFALDPRSCCRRRARRIRSGRSPGS